MEGTLAARIHRVYTRGVEFLIATARPHLRDFRQRAVVA